jgi:hypothetical protein
VSIQTLRILRQQNKVLINFRIENEISGISFKIKYWKVSEYNIRCKELNNTKSNINFSRQKLNYWELNLT